MSFWNSNIFRRGTLHSKMGSLLLIELAKRSAWNNYRNDLLRTHARNRSKIIGPSPWQHGVWGCSICQRWPTTWKYAQMLSVGHGGPEPEYLACNSSHVHGLGLWQGTSYQHNTSPCNPLPSSTIYTIMATWPIIDRYKGEIIRFRPKVPHKNCYLLSNNQLNERLLPDIISSCT